jgi:hypothetical protein
VGVAIILQAGVTGGVSTLKELEVMAGTYGRLSGTLAVLSS